MSYSEDGGGGGAHRYTWDVFLSFRGEDTRHGFVAALYDSLVQHGVRAFRDDEGMERGDEVGPTLLAAIQDSAAAIAVISKNYANSKWCLEELARILLERRNNNKLMIPVFYGVDPSDVRRQKGSFEEDFRRHEHGGEVEAGKVARWRSAMNRAGNISGFDSRFMEESEIIKILVKKVLKELNNTPQRVAEYPVGLDTRIELFLRKLDVKANDLRIIGLYGMGGIGKTTLAKALYNKLIVYFEKRSFISSVREEAQKPNGLGSLQGKLVSSINSNSQENISDTRRGIICIKKITHNDPILLILDDVDNSNQLDVLAGGRDWFHDGSRIIITSRDKDVFPEELVDEIYEVEQLTFSESVQLFSYHAFGREEPTQSFRDITEKIVKRMGGLPLALEVFGSSLFHNRRLTYWDDAFGKLELVQPGHLQEILEISFKSLDEQEKCIFLDLACFFVGMKMTRDDAIDIFRGCGFNAETIITDLTTKSLLKIIDRNVLWMHDQLRDMGRQIVRDKSESYKDAGQRSRLWDQDEILKVLKNEKGTRSIEGITLDFVEKFNPIPEESQARQQPLFGIVEFLKRTYCRYTGKAEEKDDKTLCTKAFTPMINLRLLQINNAKLDGDLKLLPAELKWLQWKGCPLETLPSEFQPRDLAVLDLSQSKICRLWKERWWDFYREKMCKKLLVLNLYSCRDLEEIPDLSGLCLEKLILERCSSLVKLHNSIGNMNKLVYLNLKDCNNLVEFPNDISGLKCLEKLILSGCTKLRYLPHDMSGLKSLRELLLDRTAVAELPESIFRLKNLEILDLNKCDSLVLLPDSIGNLSSLRELGLDGSLLQELPETIGQLKTLERLSLRWCKSLKLLPDSIGDLKLLTELFLVSSSIEKLPVSIGSLCNLKLLSMSRCANLSHIPDSIKGLSSLVSLDFGWTPITEIPDQMHALSALKTLDFQSCQSLVNIPKSIGNLLSLTDLVLNNLLVSKLPEELGSLEGLVTLKLNNCKNLQRLPDSIGGIKHLHYLYMDKTSVTELPVGIGMLSNLRVLKMRKEQDQMENICTETFVLPTSISNLSMLEELDFHACRISGKISDEFRKLSSLESLDFSYNNIMRLPSSLEELSRLKILLLSHCKELKSLPPLPINLVRLNVANCTALEDIADLSNLKSLQELELTNCNKVNNIPGLPHLKLLKFLYAGGCNACFSTAKGMLSKTALMHMRYLCVPASEVPNWFIQDIPNFSCPRNRKLKSVIIGIVVSLDQTVHDSFRNKIPSIVDIQATIIRQNQAVVTTTLYLRGVPNTDKDQLYLCRFYDYSNLVLILKDGDALHVIMRDPPCMNGVTLKRHGIHLVFENDDDYEDCDEALFIDRPGQQSVSKRLSNFFDSV